MEFDVGGQAPARGPGEGDADGGGWDPFGAELIAFGEWFFPGLTPQEWLQGGARGGAGNGGGVGGELRTA